MSERVLRVFLDELMIARVICQHKRDSGHVCGTVIEVPLESLGKVQACPTCNNELQGEMASERHLTELALALGRAKSQIKRAKVEFVIPDPDKE
jgi:hypothetical protein